MLVFSYKFVWQPRQLAFSNRDASLFRRMSVRNWGFRPVITSLSTFSRLREAVQMTDSIGEHCEDLEDLAESDLACSWIAKTLLETMDTEA